MNSDASLEHTKGLPGVTQAALFGLCPQCGERTLFAGPTRLADTCGSCGLDFSALEASGRFVGLLTMAVAAMLIAVAFAVEDTWRPNIWLQLAFWAPVTLATVIGVLRLFKTVRLYANFVRRTEMDSKHS